jgi:hypothetical protein
MKTLFSIILTILLFNSTFAQFEIYHDDVLVNNNDIFTSNSLEYPNNDFKCTITNPNDFLIRYRISVENLVNNDGGSVTVCLGTNCYTNSISVGDVFPEDGYESLDASSSTEEDGIHITFNNSGNGNYPVDFVFRLFEVDEFYEELGPGITFTYRYDPDSTTGYADQELKGVKVFPTFSNTSVKVDSSVKISSKVFDLQGRLLIELPYNDFAVIDISQLSPQTYFLVCEDIDGRKFSQKIVKL